MKIEQEITLSKDEVFELCMAKAKMLMPSVDGDVEIRSGYLGSGEVICTFKTKDEPATSIASAPAPILEPVALEDSPF